MKVNNNDTNNYRCIWIDIIKIIACFCVIINHNGGFLLEYAGYTKSTVLFYSICFSICKIGVPLFLMITGYLLLKQEQSYKKSLKRIYRIFIPLLFVSLLIYIKKNGFNISFIFIEEFINNPIIIPYWYLYMLIGLYLILPFVQKMIKNFKNKDFKCLILICLIIPGVFPILKVLGNINFSDKFFISLIPYSIGYMVAGLYLSQIPLKKKIRNISIITFILPTTITILYMYISYIVKGEISYSLDSWYYITTSLPALSIFYIIRYYFDRIKSNKLIEEISLVTFGIYLFHPLINYKLYCLSVIKNIFSYNPYIGVILLEIICFCICGIITYLLRKIPIIKKFI